MNAEIDRLDVLAVAAHPDDLEITCGGTLAKLVRQGYRVGILDLTTGEPTPRGSVEIRAAEAEAARSVLGVPYRANLGLPNRVLMDVPENRFAVATRFRQLRPGIVLTPFGRTPAASPDHYQAQLLVEGARFYSQLTKWDDRFDGTPPYRVPHLVYAPMPFDAEERHLPGSFTIDITATFEQKLQAIRCYESQFDDGRFDRVRHFVTGYNVMAGGRCGFAYGELFTVPAPIGAADFVNLVHGGKGPPAPVALPGQPPPPLGHDLVTTRDAEQRRDG